MIVCKECMGYIPFKKEMDEHIHLLEEAEKRDHRTIGKA